MSGGARGALKLLSPLALVAALATGVSAALGGSSSGPSQDAPTPRLAERDPEARARADIGHARGFDDPSGHALDALHAALRRAERGEGQARLLFYGGSHTAGDMLTGRIRELLQSRFGDAGHGFVPLVPVVPNHWAWGVRIDDAEGWELRKVGRKHTDIDRYGLIGIAFTAEEPGAFAAVTSDPWGPSRFASEITLLYDRRPGGGSMDVLLDGRKVETLRTEGELAGATRRYRVSDGPHRIEVRARGDGPVTVYGVLFERDRPGAIVENLGLVGAKARHHLWWDEDQWRGFFAARDPDFVAFVYGNNEIDDDHLTLAEHEAQLRTVLARVRSGAPDASCLLIGPTDRPARGNGEVVVQPVAAEMSEMHRRVALSEGCAFFDTLAFMGGLGAGRRWLERDPPLLKDDLMHLTRDAYLRWADVMAAALLADYPH